jgi:hypothetical protein
MRSLFGSIHLVMLSYIDQNNQIFFITRFLFKSKYDATIILDLTCPKSNQFSMQLMWGLGDVLNI